MGDTFNTATDLNQGLVSDSIGGLDPNDYYKFSLTTRSSTALVLGGLSSNADLRLYNGSQSLIQSSTNPETKDELINRMLDPGTYYVLVSSTNQTPYVLEFQANGETQKTGIFQRNYSTGANEIWWMNGVTVASTTAIADSPASQQLSVLATCQQSHRPPAPATGIDQVLGECLVSYRLVLLCPVRHRTE